MKYITFSKINDNRSLIIEHRNFIEELMKIVEDSEIIMYAYEKSEEFSTIYYFNDDIKQDREKHNMIFEKEPRIDKYLDEVIHNINIYGFEESKEFNNIRVKKIWKECNRIYLSFI